ncbi:hypothetical protein GCM10022286_12920 [Gryllotalpicola daejeonensis]|uniref:DUF4190 domain-containing protein n=1 Tax=Gryllotalpicola daejeonensis TaxID=993087 RepID=A0ABP7ZIS1_9MICO
MTTPQQPAEPGEHAQQQPQPQPQPQPTRPAPGSIWEPAPEYQPVVDRTQLPPFNVMALIAFIGAFIIPVVGIVCGHITLAEYRKGLPERGREYAKAGLILGYIFTAIWVVLAILWIVFLFTHGFGSAQPVGGRGGNGFGSGNGFGGGQGGHGFPIPSPRVTPNGGTGN